MIPNIVRGGDTRGLIAYLLGPGRANEHTNPHFVAGSAEVLAVGGLGILNKGQAVNIAKVMDRNLKDFGVAIQGKYWARDLHGKKVAYLGKGPQHVWHASLSLKPGEGPLSSEAWGQIAQEFMAEMGFIGDDVSPLKWAAIHHGLTKNGGDHIHIATVLVRDNGSIEHAGNDYRKAQRACNKLEHKFGLQIIYSREEQRRGQPGVKPAEYATARKAGRREPARRELARIIRAASMEAVNERGFVLSLRSRGVWVRPYYVKGGTNAVAGYAVALEPARGEKPIWYSGSKLGADLGLNKLRETWQQDNQATRAEALLAWIGKDEAIEKRTHAPRQIDNVQLELSQLENELKNSYKSPEQWAYTAAHISGIAAAWAESGQPGAEVMQKLSYQAGLIAQTYRPRRAKPFSLSWAKAASRVAQAGRNPQAANLATARAMLSLTRSLGVAVKSQNRISQVAEMSRLEQEATLAINRLAQPTMNVSKQTTPARSVTTRTIPPQPQRGFRR